MRRKKQKEQVQQPKTAQPTPVPLNVEKAYAEMAEKLMVLDRSMGQPADTVYMRADFYTALCVSPRYGDSIQMGPKNTTQFRGRPIVVFKDGDVPFHFGQSQETKKT